VDRKDNEYGGYKHAAVPVYDDSPMSGGVARRGYATDGAVDDPNIDGSTTPATNPDPDVAPPPPTAGVKPSWWDKVKSHAADLVPLAAGLGAMGTAPTRHLGVALAAGLQGGAQAYWPSQEAAQETKRMDIQNQGAQLGLDAARRALAPPATQTPAEAPRSPYPETPEPSDPAQYPAYYQRKYATLPMTPIEAKARENAQLASGFLKNPGIAQAAETTIQNRIQNDQFRNQRAAQIEHDQAYQLATNATDPTVRNAQIAKVNALRPWTGDEYKDGVNVRTGMAMIGNPSQILPPSTQQERFQQGLAQANEPITVGAGLPTPRWKQLGYPSDVAYAQHVTGLAPQAGTATASPAAAAPARSSPVVAPSSPQTQMLPGVDINAIPKLPPLPAATDQSTKDARTKRATSDVDVQNASLEPMREQAAQAARNTAIYSQLEKRLADADPREFGPSSRTYKALADLKTYLTSVPPDGLVNLAEVDKYLAQLGVGGSKQLLGTDQQLRQQEMMMLMAHANPNIDQPLQVIKNLAAFGKAGNDYDLRAANTGIAAIRYAGADPFQVPGAIENQLHRSDYIASSLGQPLAAPKRPGQESSGITKVLNGKTYTQRNGKWYAAD
jgi:hypothetical protein